jgi:hypothetical protein
VKAVLSLVTVSLVLAAAAVGSSGPFASPSALLRHQDALLRAGKYQALYQTFTQRFRDSCPYSTFVTQGRRNRAVLTGIRLVVVGQRIQGTRALVSYRYVRGTRVLASIRNDLYVRVGGRWYDEVDTNTRC